MSTPPSGTVTFLFTDIEGSARRWDEQPDAMRRALARHDTLLRAAIERHGGCVFKTVGDAVHAAFAAAPDALRAAVEGQRTLAESGWGGAVRVALHTGTADERDGDYFGPTLNRVARLRDAGHGGQILLSAVTAGLVRGQVPDGVELRDLGVHRLRDLVEPEQVYQAAVWGLPADFPPLRSEDDRRAALPTPLTSLVGRERELGEVARLLETARLVTLTGPGGTGKTRLALAVAEQVAEGYPDGVWFVDLSAVADPGLVASQIAQALGVREVDGRPVIASLAAYLRDKRLLAVVDNFEQVVEAAPLLRELLAASPGLTLLVTSRSMLHLSAEKEYAVPPLAVPSSATTDEAALLAVPSVALFVERARDARRGFALTRENAPAVAGICARVDGLPLALELAAARVRVLPPEALAARLERRLPLLVGGARDLPERQRTLRDTIAWSHDLLSPQERTLFRRLSVFAGGCTLAAAAMVCDEDSDLGIDVLDGCSSLIEQSLVREANGPDGEPRFGMLPTIREYAAEQLAASGEGDAVHERFVRAVLAAVRAASLSLRGPGSVAATARLMAELDNVRAALGWCVERDAAALGSRFAWPLGFFWHRQGLVREARTWAERLLALPSAAGRTLTRARLLLAVADAAAEGEGGLERIHGYLDECVAIGREVGDTPTLAQALRLQGLTYLRTQQPVAARACLEEALALLRGVGDRVIAIAVLYYLALAAAEADDLATAQALSREALMEARALGDPWMLGFALSGLGVFAEATGAYDDAHRYLEEGLALYRTGGDSPNLATVLCALARLALRRDDLDEAAARLAEGLRIGRGTDYGIATANSLDVGAALALRRGPARDAARLIGAGDALREQRGVGLFRRQFAAWRTETLDAIRAALGEEAFAAAYEEGLAFSADAAVDLALEQTTAA